METTTDLVDALRQRLHDHPDVAVAYLFGSYGRGEPSPASDVDVAILPDRELIGIERSRLTSVLAEVVGERRLDVVFLDQAPLPLAYRVLRDGRLLAVHDERRRVRHWVDTVDRYLDTAPMRRILADGLHHRLEEGRFGRR